MELQTSNFSKIALVFYFEESSYCNIEKTRPRLKALDNKRRSVISFFLTHPYHFIFLQNVISSKTENKNTMSELSICLTRSHSFSIFIAYQNPINRVRIKSLLDPYCNKITLADDGKQALSYLKVKKYDLILLDDQIPFFSDPDIINRIRQPSSINNQSPVIGLTAQTQRDRRNLFISAGFDECLIKPIVIENLLELLDLWLPQLYSHSHIKSEPKVSDYLTPLLSRTYGNTALARIILSKLFSEMLEQSKSIGSALEAKDYKSARETTHFLHGSVSYCGFTDIQKLANAMESSLYTNNQQLIYSNFLSLNKKITSFLLLKDDILNQLPKS